MFRHLCAWTWMPQSAAQVWSLFHMRYNSVAKQSLSPSAFQYNSWRRLRQKTMILAGFHDEKCFTDHTCASQQKYPDDAFCETFFCDIYAHFYSLPSLEICFPFCHFTTKLSCKDNQHFFLSFKIGCISPLHIQINELRRMERQIIGLFHILKKKCHLMQTGRNP